MDSWTDFHLDLFFTQITNENQSSLLCFFYFLTLINGFKTQKLQSSTIWHGVHIQRFEVGTFATRMCQQFIYVFI